MSEPNNPQESEDNENKVGVENIIKNLQEELEKERNLVYVLKGRIKEEVKKRRDTTFVCNDLRMEKEKFEEDYNLFGKRYGILERKNEKLIQEIKDLKSKPAVAPKEEEEDKEEINKLQNKINELQTANEALNKEIEAKDNKILHEEEYNSRISKELKTYIEKPNELLFVLRCNVEPFLGTPLSPNTPFTLLHNNNNNNSRSPSMSISTKKLDSFEPFKGLKVSDSKKFGHIKLETNAFTPYYSWSGGMVCYIPFKVKIKTSKPVGSWKYFSELSSGGFEYEEGEDLGEDNNNNSAKDTREIRLFIKPRYLSEELMIRVDEVKIDFNFKKKNNIVIRQKRDLDGERIHFTKDNWSEWKEVASRVVDIDDIHLLLTLKINISSKAGI